MYYCGNYCRQFGTSVKDSVLGDDSDEISADGPYIATMYVEGTIAAGQTDSFGMATGYQHDWTLDKIDELMADLIIRD